MPYEEKRKCLAMIAIAVGLQRVGILAINSRQAKLVKQSNDPKQVNGNVCRSERLNADAILGLTHSMREREREREKEIE